MSRYVITNEPCTMTTNRMASNKPFFQTEEVKRVGRKFSLRMAAFFPLPQAPLKNLQNSHKHPIMGMITTGVLKPENIAPQMPTPKPLTSEPTIMALTMTGKEFHRPNIKFDFVVFSNTLN